MPSRFLTCALALATALTANASAAALARTEVGLCEKLPPVPVAFHFGTGSRPLPPAVAPNGDVYIAATEGYLHALDPSGAYRWSYTLRGPVTGRPVVAPSGTVLVPTRRGVYAIRPNGTLQWAFTSPVAVLGDLIRDKLGRYNFVSDDGRLFSLSGGGALVDHVPLRGLPTALPVAVGTGLAVGYESGTVALSRPGKTQKFQLGSAVRALLPCPGAELCAVVGGQLRPVGGAASWQVPALRAFGTAHQVAVMSDDRHLSVLGPGGVAVFSLTLPEPASSAPLLDERGRVFLPLKSGGLVWISERGELVACAELASSPLGTPVADTAHHRVLASASEGVVGAIEVE